MDLDTDSSPSLAAVDDVAREKGDTTMADSSRRSEDFWYTDGNIVLTSEDGVAYRVHTSRLSQHSSVFKEMIAFPRPATDTEDHVESCPVVHLQDTSCDLESFLTYIYSAHRLYEHGGSFSPRQLVSMLRISLKYQADKLYEEANYQLQRRFPDTISDWDAIQTTVTYTSSDAGALFALANALWSLDSQGQDLAKYLLRVLYHCAQLEAEHLVLGALEPSSGTLEILAPALLARCLSAQKNLMAVEIEMYTLLFEISPHCHDGERTTRRFLLGGLADTVPGSEVNTLALTMPSLYDEHSKVMERIVEQCGYCGQHVRRLLYLKRQEVLTNLDKHV